MKCPACKGVDLAMSARSGVEIDYCPTCRGVWLDRGELDKIIAKAESESAGPDGGGVPGAIHSPGAPGAPPARAYRRDDSRDDDDDDYYRQHRPPAQPGYPGAGYAPGPYPPARKRSWWSELFD